jgi:hypothetical protein
MNLHSPFFALGGLGLWFLVLALPLLIYFVIAAFQINQAKRGPDIDRTRERPAPSSEEDERLDKKAG